LLAAHAQKKRNKRLPERTPKDMEHGAFPGGKREKNMAPDRMRVDKPKKKTGAEGGHSPLKKRGAEGELGVKKKGGGFVWGKELSEWEKWGSQNFRKKLRTGG